MKPRILPRSIAVLLTVAVFATACDDSDDPTDPGTSRSLSVLVTDAPGDVSRAWVEIVEVRLLSGGPQLVLTPEDPALIELTELVGTTHLLVEDAEVEAESLTEIRLIVGDAVLESSSGEVYVLGDPELPDGLVATGELHCPSCAQSGIKVKISDGQMELPDEESFLVLDFDVAQTFGHRAGNSGRWIMHPVIHAVLLEEDDDLDAAPDAVTGTVLLDDGVVVPECPAGTPRSVQDFLPTATGVDLVDGDGEPIVRTGVVTSEAGSFVIGGMDLGSYTLGYQPTFDFGTAVLEFQATVSSGTVVLEDADVEGIEYVVTNATCAPSG